MKNCLFSVTFACLIVVPWTTRAEDAVSPQGVTYFEKQIRPLLAKHCYACHSARTGKREGGLLLDRRGGWVEGGSSGPAIVPGDVEASLLIQAVRYTDADLQMPPDQSLSKVEIAKLERWVRLGAPDPRVKPAGKEPPATIPSDPVAGREHWAFRPLESRPLPVVRAADWPHAALDAYVLSKLEEQHLQPVVDAERRALLRRGSFQLLGLPPTPEATAAFLGDERPDAWDRVVDRWLASPHFGERWGRHWLDLARYADSNGLDENFLFREAWRYRNWVIDAVNADVPFDRFILEQIAGDLLPHASLEQRDRQRIAAGFLVVGPKVLLGNNADERRMDVADEQIDTIGRAILGQTLGCARCHDHKFDPIPTADYYALAGIFTSTQVMERRYMLGQQRLMERLVGLGANGDQADGAYETYWRQRPQRQEQHKHAQAALALLEKQDAQAFDTFAKKHADVIAAVARDTSEPHEKRVEAQKLRVAELAAAAQPPSIPPRAMIPCDVDKPADESIRLAGQFNRLGQQVPRGFLQVVNETPTGIPPSDSGRLQLGHWLTDTQHGAGTLAARVQANRLWHHLIGRGLVRTVDNFGRSGEPPTHPRLLDDMAHELIRSDWSIKHVVRKIVVSRSFRLSSRHDAKAHAVDPDNRLCWRANRRRLEPEALRDAMLAAADSLDVTPMNSSVWYLGDQATAVGANENRRRTDFPCRSVYLPVIRNDLPELFDVFDFADPHATTGMRPNTMVATQGLFILNDESVMTAAEATVRRLLADGDGDDPQKLKLLLDRILSDVPAAEEQQELLRFIAKLEQQLRAAGDPDARMTAWSLACHALFASSRFQILE